MNATNASSGARGRRRPLRIGVSANFWHPDDRRELYKGKTLLYAEESMLSWLMSRHALPVLLPRPTESFTVAELVAGIDGLLLQGGADVAPQSYGETPERPQWAGDPLRDAYELALIEACMQADEPILGICRGIQIIDVARGGTLYQDIRTAVPNAVTHRDQDLYDGLMHELAIVEGSALHDLIGRTRARVNSVHHQAVRTLGDDLVVEARCPDDGIVEAVRLRGDRYLVGIQWHPEWQRLDDDDTGLVVDPEPLLDDFLRAVERRRRA